MSDNSSAECMSLMDVCCMYDVCWCCCSCWNHSNMSDVNKDLWEAVSQDDAREVRSLLKRKRKADVNHMAEEKSEVCVQWLVLLFHFHVFTHPSLLQIVSVLMLACMNGYKKVVKSLVNEGAIVNKADGVRKNVTELVKYAFSSRIVCQTVWHCTPEISNIELVVVGKGGVGGNRIT